MATIPIARKRDRLKDTLRAVFRRRIERSTDPAAPQTPSSQSILQGSGLQEPQVAISEHRASEPKLNLVPQSPNEHQASQLNLDPISQSTADLHSNAIASSAPPRDSIWEVALSRLEQSSSTEDRSRAHALKEFIKLQHTDANSTKDNADWSSDDIIRGLKLAVEDKQADAEKWKIKIGSHTVILREVAARIIDCLNKFKEIGDLVVQYDPGHAALPWAAFRLILQVATSSIEQEGQILTAMNAVMHAHVRARVYQSLYLGLPKRHDVTDALKESIIDQFAAICAFLGLAVHYYSSNSAANAVSGLLNPSALAKYIQRITETEVQVEKHARVCEAVLDGETRQQHGERLESLLSICTGLKSSFGRLQVGLTIVEAGVGQLLEALSADQTLEIMTWISKVPYESDLYNKGKDRLNGTCEWLIGHRLYLQWKRSSVSTILWLHGIRKSCILWYDVPLFCSASRQSVEAGAGKTNLSTKVVDDMVTQDASLAYFFCDRDQEDRCDPLQVLLSITKQLSWVAGQKYVRQHTIDAYGRKKDDNFASNKFTPEECRDILLQLVNEIQQSIIIVDGLDECNNKTREDVLKTFDYLVKHTTSLVKVFVASRNDKDITQHFRSSPNLEIEAANNQDDIEKLVIDRISKSEWASMEMTSEVRQKVVQLFRLKSHGMWVMDFPTLVHYRLLRLINIRFQWATLHINELLDIESNEEIIKRLHDLPEGLEASYKRIYDSIGAKESIYAKRIFMWMMFSPFPITVGILCVLACQDSSSDFNPSAKLSHASLLSFCHNLVKVEGQGNDVLKKNCRFAHLSVQEYLEHNRLSREEARRMAWGVSLKYEQWHGQWRRVSFQEIPFGNVSDLEYGMTFMIKSSVVEFMVSATMNNEEADLWDLLLSTERGHDVVLGSPIWRALERESGCPYLMGPIYMCIHYNIPKPMLHWIEHGLFNPVDDGLTARFLVFEAWNKQQLGLCCLLLDAGTSFRGESSSELQARLVDTITGSQGQRSYSTMIRLLKRLFEDGASAVGLTQFNRHVFASGYPPEAAGLFLDNGADPNLFDEKQKNIPLNFAVACGDANIEVTRLLLKHGAEVNRLLPKSVTAIQRAAHHRDCIETLELLAKHGADPNIWDVNYYSPLQCAVICQNAEAVELLLDKGAEINAVSSGYGTALHTAALRADGKEIYDLLIARGADCKQKCYISEVSEDLLGFAQQDGPQVEHTPEEVHQIVQNRRA